MKRIFYLLRLARDILQTEDVAFRLPQDRVGADDGFLIRADKTPNAQGLIDLGIAESASESLLVASQAGEANVLIVFERDILADLPGDTPWAGREKSLLIYVGSNWNRTARQADIVLPLASLAEKSGTLTNVQGRVQRFHAAFAPRGAARNGLEIVSFLAGLWGDADWSSADPAAVFAEIGQALPAYAGLSWDSLGAVGATRWTWNIPLRGGAGQDRFYAQLSARFFRAHVDLG